MKADLRKNFENNMELFEKMKNIDQDKGQSLMQFLKN